MFAIAGLAFLITLFLAKRVFAKEDTSLYTPEQISTARHNVKTYDWAKAELDLVLSKADPWIERSDEEVWNLITGQEIPRGIHVNPNLGCPTCGRDVYKSGNYPWIVSIDPLWKLECPSCGEIWPKNDFDSFHRSGLGDGGVFRRHLADETLLFNADHPDTEDERRGYAVDDGQGWVDQDGERWWFIAFYSHYCTWAVLPDAATSLATAFLYTGDQKYAHKAAVILDRIADVYPEMDLTPYSKMDLYNSHGSSGKGKIKGCIWETGVGKTLASIYDMIYPGMADDTELIHFLSKKSSEWQILNDKSSLSKIQENIENNILREIILACKDGKIRGNEGMTQGAMATAAVVLDDVKETPPALDWLFEPGTRGEGGGHIPAVFIGEVDRDGVGNEASPSYSFGWMSNFRQCAIVLEADTKHRDYDLHRDFPRLKRMYAAPYRLTTLDTYTPRIGDTGKTADPGLVQVNLDVTLEAFIRFGDPYFAQLSYKLNGNTVEALHADVFTNDPEAIQKDIQEIVDAQGELELDSANLNGYGLTLMRTGEGDQKRAAWLYYGRSSGHGHKDRLNYGMYYRGMNILPDLGYPEYADGKWPKRAGWTKNTISHNTVTVNKRTQDVNWIGHCRLYEASEGVAIVDIASPEIYPETREYRRTMAMVDISESESYLVDFFRVDGGDDHILSFHAGEGDATTEGLDLVAQEEGTYAGTDIPFGEHFDGPPDGRYLASGFSYLYDVSRAKSPTSGWTMDWDLKDTWGTMLGDDPVRVKLHALSTSGETAIAHGDPPQNKPGNPRRLRYVVQRNQGTDIKSTFVSLVEPYSGTSPNLTEVNRIDLGLSPGDHSAAAVRVVTAAGRTDLILSSDDPDRAFDLGDGVRVAGRFAVVSLIGEDVTNVFLAAGTLVELPRGSLTTSQSEYTGTVVDLHREETGPAWIDTTGDLPAGDLLRGSQIQIDNDGQRDACYLVEAVSENGRFDLGDTTFIRGMVSNQDYSKGYVYNFEPGNTFEIPTLVHLEIDGGQTRVIRANCEWKWDPS
jgi:hypothetical protein